MIDFTQLLNNKNNFKSDLELTTPYYLVNTSVMRLAITEASQMSAWKNASDFSKIELILKRLSKGKMAKSEFYKLQKEFLEADVWFNNQELGIFQDIVKKTAQLFDSTWTIATERNPTHLGSAKEALKWVNTFRIQHDLEFSYACNRYSHIVFQICYERNMRRTYSMFKFLYEQVVAEHNKSVQQKELDEEADTIASVFSGTMEQERTLDMDETAIRFVKQYHTLIREYGLQNDNQLSSLIILDICIRDVLEWSTKSDAKLHFFLSQRSKDKIKVFLNKFKKMKYGN